jgi:5-methylcytosine-specific restriction protein B
MNRREQYQLWDEFLRKWSLEKIENMTLDEYSTVGSKDSFTYWIEAKLDSMGSIWGGSSFKFGIYSRKNNESKESTGMRSYTNQYGWYTYLGDNPQDAFEKVRNDIVSVIKAVQKNDLSSIEENMLGEMYKWKIAFHYQDRNNPLIVNVFLKDALRNYLNNPNKNLPMYQLYQLVIKKRGAKDLLDFAEEIWDTWEQGDDVTSENDPRVIPPKKKKSTFLNQILYGPPGTGKTYNTINKALEIILEKEDDEKQIIHEFNDFKLDSKVYEINEILKKKNYSKKERKFLTTTFDYYASNEQGQIEFITFHQSYGYEEFVEGIKASTNDKNEVIYQIENGIFKEFCEKAKTIKTNHKSIYSFDDKINIWKISLGDSQNSEEDYLFDYCINNKKILLGFGNGLDFNGLNDRKSIAKKLKDTEKYSYPPTAINTLKNKIKKDDIVLVSYGNKKLRAIAKIVGDYEFLHNEELDNYVQSRTVEWLLVPEEPFIYEKILKKQFSQMSIYDIKNNVKIEELKNLLTYQSNEENIKNYVFIIDEINRGNISKIFGELITLIEPSKRIGADEELSVKLPYSGDTEEPFGVPSNLYIIGTMNTADRSIAQIDTALRRRFVFEEMMPDGEKLKEIKLTDHPEIDIKKIFETINQRIEYLYDRDHTIGHSYLMNITNFAGLENAFKNKIIPLLQEYFYDDWEKIRLILADNQINNEDYEFIIEKKDIISKKLFGEKIISDNIDFDEEKKVYEFNMNAFTSPESYTKIYDSNNIQKNDDNMSDEKKNESEEI